MALTEDQKQELLRIVKVEPRSNQDIADILGVHYITAQRWMKEMLHLGLIQQMPFQRGKEKVYTVALRSLADDTLVVQVGDKLMHPAELAVTSDGLDPYKYVRACLAYLYRRSVNWDSDRYKGIWTPVDIRAQVRSARDVALQQLQVLEQLLLMDEIWQEGSAAQEAMGSHPDLGNIDTHAAPVDERFKQLHTSG